MNIAYLIGCEIRIAKTQHELECLVSWAIRSQLIADEYDEITTIYFQKIQSRAT